MTQSPHDSPAHAAHAGHAAQPGQPGQPGQEGLDLSAVRSRNTPSAESTSGAGAAPAGGSLPPNAVRVSGLVFDSDEAQFEDLVALSNDVPVIIDLWAEWCEPCKQLSPILERVVESYGGRVVLAKIDVDANPRIQQAFQVQSIPTVVALLKGQPAPLFQGAQPEQQIRQVFDQVIEVAGQQGMTKTAVPLDDAEAPEPGPAHPEALAALESGDFDGAEAIFRAALAEAPADAEAKLGLVRVAMLKRTQDLDPAAVLAAASAAPKDIDAALQAADVELVQGDPAAAFSRLLGLLPTAAPDDKERLRLRLLDLFEVVGAEDPRVVKARGRLMRALF
ncbi:tetratricopeptide repeat protein [Brevibacterium jeotgali]|uniref:Putative thioredoxin n=1 Tax=Brevibacterium jeotgali TaxID=1262550 RepID=A0A2H1L710_9MICO|nr:tetratricopeptide repeat protein [Brevibacterium jeotgali]TWC02244.1 putative thioredoxin [Brevibacterium jeotgali]SMY12704.1 putative thioredoxin [Brevibacterium jeotgali]